MAGVFDVLEVWSGGRDEELPFAGPALAGHAYTAPFPPTASEGQDFFKVAQASLETKGRLGRHAQRPASTGAQ
jgi:hypothetical protein